MTRPRPSAATRKRVMAASLLALLAGAPASAAEEAGRHEALAEAPADDLPSLLTSLPGMEPFSDAKKQLKDKGIFVQLNYIGEVFGNASGGLRQGATYDGRLELAIDADMEKIANWKGGSFHTNGYWIHGAGLSTNYVGNMLTVSNIEALPTVRLYELWFEQKLLDDRLGLRIGQLAADTEFFVSKYSALFINGTFGWPAFAGANLPSGGPGYPFATPGARVKLGNDADPVNFLAAVYNGDPAGQCGEDPQICNRYGTNFRLQDAPLALQELQYRYNQGKDDGLAGSIKLGAFEHFGDFAHQRYATALSGDWGLYGVWDQQFWKLGTGEDAAKGAAFFVRVAGGPQNRNVVNFYFDAGLNFYGITPGRPDDAFGVGFGYAHISNQARAADYDAGYSVLRSAEAVLEVTYQAQIAPGWSVQPDFQYIFSPGGGMPDVNGAPVQDAAVFGLRTTINF